MRWQESSGLESETAVSAGEEEGACLLLVEGNEEMRSATSELLSVLGYRLRSTASAARAIEIQAEGVVAISLVICSSSIPDMSGEELLTRLRRKDPQLPCLFVSAAESPAQSSRLDPSGIAFLCKPYSAAELARKLAQLT
jgi:CheY-like chemotaxis protein